MVCFTSLTKITVCAYFTITYTTLAYCSIIIIIIKTNSASWTFLTCFTIYWTVRACIDIKIKLINTWKTICESATFFTRRDTLFTDINIKVIIISTWATCIPHPRCEHTRNTAFRTGPTTISYRMIFTFTQCTHIGNCTFITSKRTAQTIPIWIFNRLCFTINTFDCFLITFITIWWTWYTKTCCGW